MPRHRKIPFDVLRERCVATQIAGRGIIDELVLDAMRRVPRELFVPARRRAEAYEDRPLPIGSGQTISQPYIVAYMIAALTLKGGETVLEIGAGSGYAAAVLSKIVRDVFTIERIESLAAAAKKAIAAAGCRNVRVHYGDGSGGWPEAAPFDAILVSAGAPQIPKSLIDQLKPGGRMALPAGASPGQQDLLQITRRHDGGFDSEAIASVRFVPLIGRAGWTSQAVRSSERKPK